MANLQVGVAGNGTVTVGAGASVHSPASNTLTLGSNNDERLRIDSSGRILIGTNSSLTQYGSQSHLQVAGTGYDGFVMTDQVIDKHLTLPAGKNAILVGPVQVAAGIGITVEAGCTLLIA